MNTPTPDQSVAIDTTPAPQRGWTPALKARFLDRLAMHGNARAACRAVALSHEAAYRLRRRDGEFARGWAAALVLARENGVQVLAERAIEGIEEPVWYRGELVGTRRRYDTRLLLAHLARLDRLADEAAAGADAGRFDELLARIAGEEAPGMDRSGDDLLPPGRQALAGEAAEAAVCAVTEAWVEASGKRGRTLTLGKAKYAAYEAECTAAGNRAGEEAEAEWDAWFARACGMVDAHAGWPDARPMPGLPGNPLAQQGAGASTGSARPFDKLRVSGPVPDPTSARAELVEARSPADGQAGKLPPFSPPWTVSHASTPALARALAGPVRAWPGIDLGLHGRGSLRRAAIDLRGAA